MNRLERAAPSVFNAHQDPLGSAGGRHRVRQGLPRDPQAIAQDYLHYLLDDYEARRHHGHHRWADLCPAYAFALTTHAARWPRGGDEATEAELAAHWEQVRGDSRLPWTKARAVVEDAWLALDRMPSAALRPLLQ